MPLADIPGQQRVYLFDPATGEPLAFPVAAPGVPQSMNTPFYRMGAPYIIDVSPTSAATPVTINRPAMAMSFFFYNPNPFMVHLAGTPKTGTFVEATTANAWWIPPGLMGPFGTLDPSKVSAFSADYALWNRAEFGFLGKAGTGKLILQYGNGQG